MAGCLLLLSMYNNKKKMQNMTLETQRVLASRKTFLSTAIRISYAIRNLSHRLVLLNTWSHEVRPRVARCLSSRAASHSW